MRHRIGLALLIWAAVAGISFAGDIQVSCPPALRVLLDGRPAGTSSAREDGLFLANVAPGVHIVRVEKDGFVPQIFKVEVRDVPLEVKVDELVPEPPSIKAPKEPEVPKPEVSRAPGDLVITSAPQNCAVEVDGKEHSKEIPVLRIEGLTPGEHTVSFSKPGFDPVSGVVVVPSGREITIKGDLLAGKVETVYQGQGSLRLTSVPEFCRVRILGTIKDKTGLTLNVTHLPAGEHSLEVVWKGFKLSRKIKIIEGQRTLVAVSFIKGQEPFVIRYEPE